MPRELSCDGYVIHRRSEPVTHVFRYRAWMLLLDIDRLVNGTLVPHLPLSVRDGHVLDRAEVEARLRDHGLTKIADQILVLTQPKSFGFSFNPVNFYFCYHAGSLRAILADISNTPWGEKHCYVLPVDAGQSDFQFSFPKSFHVSPFLPMDGQYQWRFTIEREKIHIAMRFVKDGVESFFAGLYLSAQELTKRRLIGGLLRFPIQNLQTLARIYWQASRLYFKRAPFYSHPKHLASEPKRLRT